MTLAMFDPAIFDNIVFDVGAVANEQPKGSWKVDTGPNGYLHRVRQWPTQVSEEDQAAREEEIRREKEREEQLRKEAIRLQRELAEARRKVELAKLTADLEARDAAIRAERNRQAIARAELNAVQAERQRIAELIRQRREEEDVFFMLLAA